MAARSERDPVAWVLNLDADLELASGKAYAPTKGVRKAMQPHVDRLAASLLAPGDLLVTEASPPGAAAGLPGRAFCPTKRAIALLDRAGAAVAVHPSHDVLREVNGRAFCAALGQTLPGAVFATDLEEALARIRTKPALAERWRLKRAFGMAGRGQRCVTAGRVDDADRSFLRASIEADGGVQLEPDVRVARELGLHAMLTKDGNVSFGRLVEQRCDAHGQWQSTALASDVDDVVATALGTEAKRVGEALHRKGYFGPFGIDAFLYRDLDGALRLQPRSEINARYSMGFAVGFGRP